MQSITNFCAIPGSYGYKWPKLSELHYKLFGSYFEEAHNAAVDITTTAKCFGSFDEWANYPEPFPFASPKNRVKSSVPTPRFL